MLDPIPIIFVLIALVGVVILIANHLPELENDSEEQIAREQPTWAAKTSLNSIFRSLGKKLGVFFRQVYRTAMSAKSEFRNSRDIAKHFSDNVRTKISRRKAEVEAVAVPVQVREVEEEEEENVDEVAEAERLLAQGQSGRAEEIAIEILKKDPSDRSAYEILGHIYTENKSFLEAVEVYRYLIKQVPGNEEYWEKLGDNLVGLDDYAEAVKSYRKALSIYAKPEIFVSLGLAYQGLNDYLSASKSLESALDIEPENTQVMMLLAQNYVSRGDTDGAESILEQVLELEPGNHVARERLMQLKV